MGASIVRLLAGVRETKDRLSGNPVSPIVCALIASGTYGNNKTFFIPVGRPLSTGCSELAVDLVARLAFLPHMKDEALSPRVPRREDPDSLRPMTSASRSKTCRPTAHRVATEPADERRRDILDWLKVEHAVAEPSTKLAKSHRPRLRRLHRRSPEFRGKKNPLSLAALRTPRGARRTRPRSDPCPRGLGPGNQSATW